MKRRTLITFLAVTVLIPVGVALAAFSQTARTRLTAHRSGQSSGVTVTLAAADPTAPGAKPRPVRTITLRLPERTQFDFSRPGLRACRLSDHQLKTPFGPTCPTRSRIGSVQAIANAAPIAAIVKEPGTVYVTGSKRLMIVLRPALPGAPVEVIHGTVKAATMVLNVPHVVWGKLVGVSLVSFKLDIPAQGSGRSALITAGDCTRSRFTVEESFVYRDGTRVKLTSASRCSS